MIIFALCVLYQPVITLPSIQDSGFLVQGWEEDVRNSRRGMFGVLLVSRSLLQGRAVAPGVSHSPLCSFPVFGRWWEAQNPCEQGTRERQGLGRARLREQLWAGLAWSVLGRVSGWSKAVR